MFSRRPGPRARGRIHLFSAVKETRFTCRVRKRFPVAMRTRFDKMKKTILQGAESERTARQT
jgi:hypothetical protein